MKNVTCCHGPEAANASVSHLLTLQRYKGFKMKTSKVRKYVSLVDLKNARYNPKRRIESKSIRVLKDSMDTFGQLMPIMTTISGQIIEGHRRVQAARELGWEFLEAEIIKDAGSESIYATINTTGKQLSGCDSLNVWLIEPLAVTPKMRSFFEEMQTSVGRSLLKRIATSGYSWRVYVTATRIACYCDIYDDQFLKQIIEWLLSFPMSGKVLRVIESRGVAQVITQAIKTHKPLTLKG